MLAAELEKMLLDIGVLRGPCPPVLPASPYLPEQLHPTVIYTTGLSNRSEPLTH
jgi:hypothetical protein